MFIAIGDDPINAVEWATNVVRLEIKILEILQYNNTGITRRPMNITDLKNISGGLAIDEYLDGYIQAYTAASIPLTVYITNNNAFIALRQLVDNTPLTTLLAYSRWYLINQTYQYLSPSLQQTYFNYFTKHIEAIQQDISREIKCTYDINKNFPDLIIQTFIQENVIKR